MKAYLQPLYPLQLPCTLQRETAREGARVHKKCLANSSVSKMAVVQPYLSIYTLNINELNFPVKRYRMAEWIKKEKKKISICMWPTRPKGHTQTEMKGWKKILHAIGEH